MSKEISPYRNTSKFQVRTKKFIRKEMVIGFLVSVFATFSGAFLYLEFLSKKGFDQTWKNDRRGKSVCSFTSYGGTSQLIHILYFY